MYRLLFCSMFSYCCNCVRYCSICLRVWATDSMAVMMFCARFVPSMTGMPACAGVMMMLPARTAASAVLAAKRRTCFMVEFLDVMKWLL